jgi:hypothetical protein
LGLTVLKAAVRAIAASNGAAVDVRVTMATGLPVADLAMRRAVRTEVRDPTETTRGRSWQRACAGPTKRAVVNQACAVRAAASARRVLPAETQVVRAVGREEEVSAVRRPKDLARMLLPASFAR